MGSSERQLRRNSSPMLTVNENSITKLPTKCDCCQYKHTICEQTRHISMADDGRLMAGGKKGGKKTRFYSSFTHSFHIIPGTMYPYVKLRYGYEQSPAKEQRFFVILYYVIAFYPCTFLCRFLSFFLSQYIWITGVCMLCLSYSAR